MTNLDYESKNLDAKAFLYRKEIFAILRGKRKKKDEKHLKPL
jgi:hypothetical protein